MAKDAKGHGSDKRGNAMPIAGHPYHTKSDAELRHIVSDASAAAKASQGMSSYNPNSSKREDTEGKYLDQVNDASSVLGYRARGGSQVQPTPAAHASGVTSVGGHVPPDGTRIMRDGVPNSTRSKALASDPVHRTSPIDGQHFK